MDANEMAAGADRVEMVAPLALPRQGVLRSSLRLGLAAARANLAPGAVLWCIGIAVVLSYLFWPAAQVQLDHLAAFKQRWGIWYAAPALAFFGGLLPLVLRVLNQRGRIDFSAGFVAFVLLFWAVKGIEIDLLYRAQAWLFGDNRQPLTLAIKVVVDQFIYCPIWGIPSVVLPYAWAQDGFRWRHIAARMDRHWYQRDMLPVLISNWAVWVPSVALIYCLPLALQLPLQNLVTCLWVLLLTFMTRRPADAPDPSV